MNCLTVSYLPLGHHRWGYAFASNYPDRWANSSNDPSNCGAVVILPMVMWPLSSLWWLSLSHWSLLHCYCCCYWWFQWPATVRYAIDSIRSLDGKCYSNQLQHSVHWFHCHCCDSNSTNVDTYNRIILWCQLLRVVSLCVSTVYRFYIFMFSVKYAGSTHVRQEKNNKYKKIKKNHKSVGKWWMTETENKRVRKTKRIALRLNI